MCAPQASGLGGHSLGLVHFEGRTFAVDGSGRAPSLAHRSRLKDPERLRIGYRATTVPGTPATYGWLHRNYGRLDWQTVVAPAIRLARHGYRITQLQHDLQVRERDNFLAVAASIRIQQPIPTSTRNTSRGPGTPSPFPVSRPPRRWWWTPTGGC